MEAPTAAIKPAPMATRTVSKNVSGPDLMAAFQLAWRSAREPRKYGKNGVVGHRTVGAP